MADRSPNFPSLSLGEAIDAIKLIYQREGRSKMPRLSAVKPLGYTSINGRSLSILGALRAYNLLDGRGDDVRVSDDAITIINAPQGSAERTEALVRAFEGPAAFAILRAKDDASPDTLRWHLIKGNFRDDSADKLLKVYLASRDLVNAAAPGYEYNTPNAENGDGERKGSPRIGDTVRWESQGVIQFENRRVFGISDDGDWAFVEGSTTGVPMSELAVLERAPLTPPPPQNYLGKPPLAPSQRLTGGAEPDFIVKLGDGRVAIIEIKGGEAEARHLKKLGRFIKLQEALLGDDEDDEPAEVSAEDLI